MGTTMDVSALRVLIVDDSAAMRLMVRAILKKAGVAETRDAEDGAGALEILKSWTPDIVLIDHQMPGMSGFELIRRIRLNKRDEISGLPIILITAASEEEIDGVMHNAGADDWLIKPFEAKGLMRRIERCLDAVLGG